MASGGALQTGSGLKFRIYHTRQEGSNAPLSSRLRVCSLLIEVLSKLRAKSTRSAHAHRVHGGVCLAEELLQAVERFLDLAELALRDRQVKVGRARGSIELDRLLEAVLRVGKALELELGDDAPDPDADADEIYTTCNQKCQAIFTKGWDDPECCLGTNSLGERKVCILEE